MADENEIADQVKAQLEQRELMERRDALLEAREKMNDPWADHDDDPKASGPMDLEGGLTALADLAHSFGDKVADLGDGLEAIPGVGHALSQGADALGAGAHTLADQRDRDQDGLSDAEERTKHTNRNDDDTDNDGLPDGVEVKTYHSNPLLQDSDGDHRSDYDEAAPKITYDGDDVNYGYTPAPTTPPPPPPHPGDDADGPITHPSQVDSTLSFLSAPDTDDFDEGGGEAPAVASSGEDSGFFDFLTAGDSDEEPA
jgi:hypothetical protein